MDLYYVKELIIYICMKYFDSYHTFNQFNYMLIVLSVVFKKRLILKEKIETGGFIVGLKN